MRINTNMAALNAWRNLEVNSTNMQKSLEKLSSGYRINKAADDAAGLAVSEKMRAQIRGLNQASRNAQDGIALVQTAEGGAGQIQSMLQRMRELTVQASNGALTDPDRSQLNTEFQQLLGEIDRSSGAISYNNIKLLSGATPTGAVVSNSNTAVATIAAGPTAATASHTLVVGNIATAGTASSVVGPVTADAAGYKLKINGTTVATATAGETIDKADIARQINAAGVGVSATVDQSTGKLVLTNSVTGDTGAGSFDITETDATDVALGSATNTLFNSVGTTTVAGTKANYSVDGVAYSSQSNSSVTTGMPTGITATLLSAGTSILGVTAATTSSSPLAMKIQVGANDGDTLDVSINKMDTTSLSVNGLAIDSLTNIGSGSSGVLQKLDTAINSVSSYRAGLGAIQNRLENINDTLTIQSENLTGAESRIRDVDMASEMATFTKHNILTQASQSMLAQANQSTQGILSLLRG